MTPPERPVPEHVLARSVIAPLGGLLKVGAVTATGTWSLSDASVGAYVERRRSEVDRLLAGIHTVGGFGPVFMAVLDELGYLRDHEVTSPALLLWSGGVEGVPADGPEDWTDLERPAAVRRMCRMAADLQLTEFLHGLLTAAIAAGVEAGRAASVRQLKSWAWRPTWLAGCWPMHAGKRLPDVAGCSTDDAVAAGVGCAGVGEGGVSGVGAGVGGRAADSVSVRSRPSPPS